MRETIHFVHGNGFPSPCYRQLFLRLETQFDCCYLDRVGHSNHFPVTENWHYLVSEVVDSVREQSSQPVIALGHSLGGVLSLLAAIEHPELFKAVIMLDSPMLGRMKSVLLRCFKTLGLIDHVTPASRTRNRRQHWQTREQVVHYLRRRLLFKFFDEACLQDYIDYGMVQTEKGYALRFDPRIEYQIYRTIPHVSYQYEGQLQIPAALIYGDKSHIIHRSVVQYMKKKYGIVSFRTHGTHMFPMEYPDACAGVVMNVIERVLGIGQK